MSWAFDRNSIFLGSVCWKLLCVPVGLGERHVVAAPLQHLRRSRLTIRAHFNLRCLLLPALIGLLVDLSHAYITTLLPGSFRAPHSWDVWSVNR
jgi:hypothetical protein